MHSFGRIIGRSQAIRDVISLADKIARSDASIVSIQGETGVGKDLLARAIHYESARRDKPFMEVSSTTLPEHLLELADGGTVFLNEIGHVPPALQAKLLSFMEHKAFGRVGGNLEIGVEVRIIVATNRDLKAKMEDDTFREYLHYRLHVLPILVPPLREREEDIALLGHLFPERFNGEFRKEIEGFSESAEERLLSCDWSGRAREL